MYSNIEQITRNSSWLSDINMVNFEAHALSVFHYQYENCIVYNEFVKALRIKPGTINNIQQIPFLPISFFKSHKVVTGNFTAAVTFESSGTTGMQNSKHFVKDTGLYEDSFMI